MKSLGANRSRHLSDSCGPTAGPQEPICPLTPDPHTTYLLTPTINHYGTLDQHMHAFPPASPIALQPDCLLPLSAQLANSGAFPHFQFPAQPQQQGCLAQPGSRPSPLAATMPVGMGMGMGLGLGLAAPPMISSGTATISSAAAAKMNRLPASLLDQLERHLPLQRDGFSTLQFHRRSRGAKQRSESPGRIRNLVHSVQRLFAKAPAGEGSAGKAGGQGGDGGRAARRSKSKDRAKTEGAKRRARPNLSGFWSSDDALEDEAASPPTTEQVAVAYRNPLTMMTLGRAVSDSQAPARPHVQGYNTIATHSLRTSQSSGDLKPQALAAMAAVGAGTAPPAGGQAGDGAVVKRGSWSTLTLSQARQVVQKSTATLNRTLLKSKSCHQDLTCNFLQVPLGDASGTLGKGGGGGPGDIPCRRMRSGSYVKAMAETEDSDESEGPPSPKPSPKTAARRQSYLRATQQSLSEQQPPPPPRNCLPSLRELSTNRSLDNLDCLVGPSDAQCWEPDGRFGQSCSTLGRNSGISQVEQQGYLCSMACGQVESQAVEALDLPTPSCFRSRSHSYLRAIQAGCSQDDDSVSVDSDEPLPPPPAPRHTYGISRTCKKTPPPVPPRIKPLIALTVQSSTESAQDTYLDNQDQRGEANSQSGRSNSSDSVTSSRTGSLAKSSKRPPLLPQAPIPAPREPPLPLPSARVSSPPPPSPASETPPISITLTTTDEPQAAPRRKLSSIGVQVDCVQPVLREEHTPTTKFQSIGVQVEDGRPLSRYSSMASRQETADVESQDPADGKPAGSGTMGCGTQTPESPEGCERTSHPSRAAVSRSISGSIPESLDPALDPSSLPPPDPSLQISGSVNGAAEQAGTPAACLRDGHWFLKLLQAETGRMEAWCQQMEQESKEKQLSEEVLGKIRSAVGSAQLLMSQKFQQFRGLCEQNLDADAQPQPTAQDLAGFWDLLQLSIEDISMKFDELHLLKSNAWNLPENSSKKEEKKQPSAQTPKKAPKSKVPVVKEKSGGEPTAADKQRQEARRRLMAAKRAVSERQNSATESADSIEIYVPEAQTRL